MSDYVEVSCPARIHIDLIDMNGALGRINGSIGFAVENPRCRLLVSRARRHGVRGASSDVANALVARIERAAVALGVTSGAHVELLETIPRHSGLGSGTQLELGVLAALNELYGCGRSVRELLMHSSRGRTSGIGTHAFLCGGFVLDGGRVAREAEPVFAPSRFASEAALAPLLFWSRFPASWTVVIYVPREFAGLSGEEERRFMQLNTPVPRDEVAAVCHTVLMEMLPALKEEELGPFARSVERIQSIGWKACHWRRPDLHGLSEVAARLGDTGIQGVGLSSTGPALFGFCKLASHSDEQALRERVLESLAGVSQGQLFVTAGANHGVELGHHSQQPATAMTR